MAAPGHCFRRYLQTPSLYSEQGRVKVRQLHLHPTFPQALNRPLPAPGMCRWWAHPPRWSEQTGEGANGFEKTAGSILLLPCQLESDQGLCLHLHAGLRLALTLTSTWDPTLTPQVDGLSLPYSRAGASQYQHVSQPRG